MRKLALEAFKTAGIKKDTLEKTVAGDSISGNKGSDKSEIKKGDSVRFKSKDGNLEIEGIAKEVNRQTVWITITNVIKATSQADAETYKVGNKHGFGSKFVTKINNINNDLNTDKSKQFSVGDFVKYKAGIGEDVIEINGVITSVDGLDKYSSFVNITTILSLPKTPHSFAADWQIGQMVSLYKGYMHKIGEKI